MNIPEVITVNVEKLGEHWIAEVYFPKSGEDPQWIAKDKNRHKAILKAQKKLLAAYNRLESLI